jgi:flagellar basal-body rod protein FlgF
MDTTTLITLSRQDAMARSMDVIANNLANLNTTSYKSETVLFEVYLQEVVDEEGVTQQVSLVHDYGTLRKTSEGSFVQTDNDFNIAIRGDGYLVTENQDGEQQYTRSGVLSLDLDGQLVAASGNAILDSDGNPIVLTTTDYNFSVSKDGTISTSNGPRGKIQIVSFENEQALVKVGNGSFTTDEIPLPAENASIVQGMLERSNVSSILEMTKMIDVSRSYQSAAKAMKTNGDLIRKAINELGNV